MINYFENTGIAGMKKEPKKKGSQGKSMDVLAHVGSGGDSGDENAMPVYQKPKTTRTQRAQMLVEIIIYVANYYLH